MIAGVRLNDFPKQSAIDDALAPPDYSDPVIEAYEKDVDRTLLRENLKLTVDERFRKFESFVRFARELHDAGQTSRSKD